MRTDESYFFSLKNMTAIHFFVAKFIFFCVFLKQQEQQEQQEQRASFLLFFNYQFFI